MSDSKLNIRLYKRMANSIEAYKKRQLELKELIFYLAGLHDMLEQADEHWNGCFHESVGLLQEIYAVALDRKQGKVDVRDEIAIEQALERLACVIDADLMAEQRMAGELN